MITNVQSIESERLGKEEGSRKYAGISLVKGKWIDFMGGLGAGEDKNEGYQVLGRWGGGEHAGKMSEFVGGILGWMWKSSAVEIP